MTPLVFISHSSQDRRIATRVCEALERLGLASWLASRDISPGENFQEAIVKAIRTVRVMVLVFTGNANNSSEIKKEVALASQNGLVVIPLRVEDVMPSDAFLYELSTRQWVDAFDDWDRAMNRLAEQIGEIAGQPRELPVGPHPGPYRSAAQRHRLVWLAAAAAAILVIVCGVAYRFKQPAGAPAALAPAASTVAAAPPQPASVSDVSGKWVTGELTNPYDQSQKSVLRFDFEQSGDALFGTVSEKAELGGSIKGIADGRVNGDGVTFYTRGMSTTGNDEQPYKENYHGTLKGGEIEFIRQNDIPSGGLPQKFTAKRE